VGRASVIAAAVAILATGAASAAWGVCSAAVALTNSSPTAGPAGVASSGGFPGGSPDGFPGGFPGGDGFSGGQQPGDQNGTAGGAPTGNGTGSGGGPGDGDQNVDAALVKLLQATDTRWAAAANGSMQAIVPAVHALDGGNDVASAVAGECHPATAWRGLSAEPSLRAEPRHAGRCECGSAPSIGLAPSPSVTRGG
jgi:hypothetical protein